MDYKEIVEFITQNPVCTLATTEEDRPHVRAFLTNIIDGKLYFTTSTTKKVGQQIMQNRKCELCYLSVDFSKMLRISTTIEILDEKNIKQYLIDTRDYLKGFSADDETFLLLALKNSKANFWTITDNMRENQIEIIEF